MTLTINRLSTIDSIAAAYWESARFIESKPEGELFLMLVMRALQTAIAVPSAEIELAGLSSRALKRRLGQAAKQTGYSLKWARDGGGGVLRFQVREARGSQPKARNGRRGRRRRSE